jgi:hypothetical protein
VTLKTAGNQTITVTDAATPSITGTSNSIDVGAQGASGFIPAGDMETPRQAHMATMLSTGKVLVTGGAESSKGSLATAELFDPNTGSFTATGAMGTARSSHTATLISGGKVLVTGGIDGSGFALPSAEMFDPASGAFTPMASSMETARESHTATLRKDGTVLVAGGAVLVPAFCGINCITLAPVSLSKSELFDPTTQTFTGTGDLGTARFLHTATLLSDGSVLVTGGADSKVIGKQQVSSVLSTTELFQ